VFAYHTVIPKFQTKLQFNQPVYFRSSGHLTGCDAVNTKLPFGSKRAMRRTLVLPPLELYLLLSAPHKKLQMLRPQMCFAVEWEWEWECGPAAGTGCPASGPPRTQACRRPWSRSGAASAGSASGPPTAPWSWAAWIPVVNTFLKRFPKNSLISFS